MARFAGIRRAIIMRKPIVSQIALVAAGLVLATGSRWLLDRGDNGAPFATFLPIIILAAVFLDWPAAVATALGSLVICAWLFFDVATRGLDPNVARMTLVAFFLLSVILLVGIGQILQSIIVEAARQAEQLETFNAELQHRVKNALHIVSALASRASGMNDPGQFYESLSGRINALIQANEFLGVGGQREGELHRLVDIALRPFDTRAISVHGPRCLIDGEVGMRLTMALHELATNATKYGALSVTNGRVSITWRPQGDQMSLLWQEAGGPPVLPPSHRGLGSRILAPQGPLAEVAVDYAPAGVSCAIRFMPA